MINSRRPAWVSILYSFQSPRGGGDISIWVLALNLLYMLAIAFSANAALLALLVGKAAVTCVLGGRVSRSDALSSCDSWVNGMVSCVVSGFCR